MHASEGFVHFLSPRTRCSSLRLSGYFLSFVLLLCSNTKSTSKCRFWPFLDSCDRSMQNNRSCGVGGEQSMSYLQLSLGLARDHTTHYQ